MNNEELLRKLISDRIAQSEREKEMIEGIRAREGEAFAQAANLIIRNSWRIFQTLAVARMYVPDEVATIIFHVLRSLDEETEELVLIQAAEISDFKDFGKIQRVVKLISEMRKERITLIIKEGNAGE